MREACVRAVNAAMRQAHGRDATEPELRDIETRIQRERINAAREDPDSYRALSEEEQLAEAGRRAADSIITEKTKLAQRADQTIIAHDRIASYRNDQVAEGRDPNGVDAMERTLVNKYDLKSGGFQSVESRANATFDYSVSQIADIFETVNPGLWQRVQRGIWTMAPLRRAFTGALHGLTENIPPEIIAAAKRYHQTAEALRQQFNAAGGIVGRLENWGAPHTWSARLAQRVGRERFAADMTQWADRRAYVHEDGRYYTEPELRAFFEEAWATIVSDGMTKETEPALYGSPQRQVLKANRGSHHRVIHLRPEVAHDALTRYSEQNVLEAMMGGLRRMSRDVALVETFGPNSDYQFRLQLEKAKTEAAQIDPTQASRLGQRARALQNLYDQLAGNTPPPSSRKISDAFSTFRNLQIASKLGSAVISSIGDFPTLYQTALLHRLNPMKVALNSSLAWAPKSRRYARRMGLMLDSLLGEMERYSGENLTTRDLSARAASTVVNLSGLPFVTNARRLGFSMTLMDSIGHLTRQRQYADVSRLHESDRAILAAKNITQQTWDIWRAARIDNWGANHTLLTPDNIMAVEGVPVEARRQAVIDLLAIVREEQDLAVITAGARERWGMLDFAGQPHGGTIGGEIVRSMFLFKSFPWALMTRHWERSGFYGNKGRLGYGMALFIFMTMGGVLANWINDLLTGKDPRNMNVMSDDEDARAIATRNWIAGSLKGGALGVYGDFLFSEASPYSGNSLAETMAGPNVSTAASGLGLTVGNAVQAASDQETHVGAEAVRFARSLTPAANLWQIKGLTDRLIWNQLMELAEPGAVERMRERQESAQGTTYWWNPDELAPDRAPDLEAATRAN